MDNQIYYINLYDYYKELLTEKQKQYFEEYYFDNLSLSEISENEQISRNAVHKQIKDVEKKLEYYEEKLHLFSNYKQLQKLIQPLESTLKEKIEEFI